MPDQGPVVMIGLQQIYDKLVALERDVARLVDQHDGVSKASADHEARIRVLERARWPLPAVSVLIAVASLAYVILTR
ncbi:hypothetical protein [Phytohabitans aurantiacus]|uniref:DUF3618 domain-containing protein n=1 Tax=Phytohabitans aurantiacus TaxID=3016789 RepID=A0ABQ5R0T8_9ACTN|nr:hypothetical protein [Phytohabitans aurantiacus]GLI00300.1 hypothetical protein Pa4123_55760 [Phytohabitans aurantiacus]